MQIFRQILFGFTLLIMVFSTVVTVLNLAKVVESPYIHMTFGECILAVLALATILYGETKPQSNTAHYKRAPHKSIKH
jgi:hypothetical protein